MKQPLRLTTAQLFIRTPSLSTLRKKKLDGLLRSPPFPHAVSFRRVCVCVCVCTHSRTHTHTHAHAHMHAHTHTHTSALHSARSGTTRVCEETWPTLWPSNPFAKRRREKQFMELPAVAQEEEQVAWQPEGRWFNPRLLLA